MSTRPDRPCPNGCGYSPQLWRSQPSDGKPQTLIRCYKPLCTPVRGDLITAALVPYGVKLYGKDHYTTHMGRRLRSTHDLVVQMAAIIPPSADPTRVQSVLKQKYPLFREICDIYVRQSQAKWATYLICQMAVQSGQFVVQRGADLDYNMRRAIKRCGKMPQPWQEAAMSGQPVADTKCDKLKSLQDVIDQQRLTPAQSKAAKQNVNARGLFRWLTGG